MLFEERLNKLLRRLLLEFMTKSNWTLDSKNNQKWTNMHSSIILDAHVHSNIVQHDTSGKFQFKVRTIQILAVESPTPA